MSSYSSINLLIAQSSNYLPSDQTSVVQASGSCESRSTSTVLPVSSTLASDSGMLLLTTKELPPEIVYQIIVLRLSEYLHDLFFDTSTSSTSDAIRPLMQTCRRFRLLTLDILSYLFQGHHIDTIYL